MTRARYFWPAGVFGLVLRAWEGFGPRPITEADIEHEVRGSRYV